MQLKSERLRVLHIRIFVSVQSSLLDEVFRVKYKGLMILLVLGELE